MFFYQSRQLPVGIKVMVSCDHDVTIRRGFAQVSALSFSMAMVDLKKGVLCGQSGAEAYEVCG